jgi:hypothetical protein
LNIRLTDEALAEVPSSTFRTTAPVDRMIPRKPSLARSARSAGEYHFRCERFSTMGRLADMGRLESISREEG